MIEPPIAHQFETAAQQRDSAITGMWVFLATEVLFFGGLFTAYTVYRVLYPHAFAQASEHLYLWLGAVNTALLLTSSWTMVRAVQCMHDGASSKAARFLLATAGLGGTFLLIKAVEYYLDYRDGLIPGSAFHAHEFADPGRVQLFFVLYLIMTGLHALHMVVGIGLILTLAWLLRTPGSQHLGNHVEATGLYWHFVDVVWIFLFPLFYLAR